MGLSRASSSRRATKQTNPKRPPAPPLEPTQQEEEDVPRKRVRRETEGRRGEPDERGREAQGGGQSPGRAGDVARHAAHEAVPKSEGFGGGDEERERASEEHLEHDVGRRAPRRNRREGQSRDEDQLEHAVPLPQQEAEPHQLLGRVRTSKTFPFVASIHLE